MVSLQCGFRLLTYKHSIIYTKCSWWYKQFLPLLWESQWKKCDCDLEMKFSSKTLLTSIQTPSQTFKDFSCFRMWWLRASTSSTVYFKKLIERQHVELSDFTQQCRRLLSSVSVTFSPFCFNLRDILCHFCVSEWEQIFEAVIIRSQHHVTGANMATTLIHESDKHTAHDHPVTFQECETLQHTIPPKCQYLKKALKKVISVYLWSKSGTVYFTGVWNPAQ